MGVIYSVFPMDAHARAGLAAYDVRDEGWPDGRNPTIAEVRSVLDHLPGYRVEYEPAPTDGSSWGVTVEDATAPDEGAWTLLRTLEYTTGDTPVKIYFEKGWPDLIVNILARLAANCGTLFLVPDTGEAPLVIPVGADPATMLSDWEHTCPVAQSGFEDEG